MVPWSGVSVFGFFVFFCAFTYAATDTMIKRTTNPAIPAAMKTGSQLVSSSRKKSLRLEYDIHIKHMKSNKLEHSSCVLFCFSFTRYSYLPFSVLFLPEGKVFA